MRAKHKPNGKAPKALALTLKAFHLVFTDRLRKAGRR